MRVRSTVLSTLVLGFAAAGVNAAIVEHVGNVDPTTEGFTYDSLDGGNIATGGLTNDAGSGYNAWMVDDNSTSGYGYYYNDFSAGEQTQLIGTDWTGAARLRMPDNNESEGGAPYVDFNLGDGGKRFLIYFGTQADGNPKWFLYGDAESPRAITGLGTGYHLYEVRYDSATTNADLYVDGNLALANWTGISGAGWGTGRVAFGSGSGGDTGQGNYNLVTIDVIPEPATLSLVAMGALFGLRRRSR